MVNDSPSLHRLITIKVNMILKNVLFYTVASGSHVAFYIPMHWIGRGHLFLFAAQPLFRDLALVLYKGYIERRSTESVKFRFMPKRSLLGRTGRRLEFFIKYPILRGFCCIFIDKKKLYFFACIKKLINIRMRKMSILT